MSRGGIFVDVSSRVTPCPSCGTKNRVPAVATGSPRCASCKAQLPWVADAGDGDIAEALQTSRLVLLDLWAPWCGPCRMVAPVLEKLAVRYAGRIKIVKVNVDHNPATAARYNASSIPTLVFVQDGRAVETVVGAQPESVLAQRIDSLLAT